MEEYKFEPKGIVIHWYIRLGYWLVAKRDNRVLYKQFTTDLHLDKLKKEDISYVLPEKYLVSTNKIGHLYNVRDEILIKIHHREYVDKQNAIDNRIKELESEHVLLKDRRVDEKDHYDKLRKKLKSIKNSEDLIAMQSRVSQAHAKLKNTDAAIKKCENQVSELVRTKKLNYTNWGKQIKLVEKTVENAIAKYTKSATKSIELKYGFTSFVHDVAKYDNDLKKIINGDY